MTENLEINSSGAGGDKHVRSGERHIGAVNHEIESKRLVEQRTLGGGVIYIGAEIKNEHMRGGWRGEKRNGRSAGGRPQSGDKPYVAASSRCPRGHSRGRGVVSVVARTFGLLLLPSLCPLPPSLPPHPPAACRSRPVLVFLDELPLGLYRISPRSKHRERRWEKEIGSRRLALVWRVSLRLFRTVRTVSLLCRVPRERGSNDKKIARLHGSKWIAVIWWFVVSSILEEPKKSGAVFCPMPFRTRSNVCVLYGLDQTR